MTWDFRVAQTIKLISPMGQIIEAKWKGDPRSIEKNIQRDKFPLIAGEYGKDLGSGGEEYTFTIHFDGLFCDLAADQFYLAAKEIGTWKVTHPVHGTKTLLLLRTREMQDPTDSGGVVTFDTEWFEPLDMFALLSALQISGIVWGLAQSVPPLSASAFAAALQIGGFGAIGSVLSASAVIGLVAQGVAQTAWAATVAASSVSQAQEVFDSNSQDLSNQIQATKDNTEDYDPAAISQAMAGMFQATTIGTDDPDGATTNLANAAADIYSNLPETDGVLGPADANKAYTIQTALEGVMSAACLAQTFTTRSTRSQAVNAVKALSQLFEDIVNALDPIQVAFEDFRATKQFYAQSETYEAIRNLVSYTIAYLLKQTFDLAIEKRYKLEEDKTPIQICFEEFGADGEDRLDDFIEWNQLEGDDILLLPSGREIVVYVSTR